jgi:hypothetical protein
MTAAGLTGADAAPDATPQQDSVGNLLKYAFNMNLAGPDASTMLPGGSAGLPLITAQPNGANSIFRFEFLRRRNGGLIYTPRKSTDLDNPAAWSALTDEPSIATLNDDWERVIYEEPYDAGAVPHGFGRVEITLPP